MLFADKRALQTNLKLAALVSTTLLAMTAPGLALRGPDGSMNVAIDSMIGEYRTAFFQLLLGLFALHTSVISFCWLQMNHWEAFGITLCILSAAAVELRYIRLVFNRFQLPAAAPVTGKFEGAEAVRAGAEAGLRSHGEISTLSQLIQQQSTGLGWQEAERVATASQKQPSRPDDGKLQRRYADDEVVE